ncbi:MAG TPA: DUF1501 domain-containing protein [Pirellulales bacterium]|nr:DUF1501 domain-containing protein [Pirellulales bacterium]
MRGKPADGLSALPHRRQFLRAAGMAALGYSASGWLPQLARALAVGEKRRRHCIVLWMSGGPSQLDTFDPKPDHANGGEFKAIDTAVPGLRVSEHLPRLATHAKHLAILRGLSTKEGDHGRGTYLMRTGHVPGGPVRYPAIGASLGKELGSDEAELPQYISIAPYQQFNQAAFGAGFLGPRYAPVLVEARRSALPAGATAGNDAQSGEGGCVDLRFENLAAGDASVNARLGERVQLWQEFESGFLAAHRAGASVGHETVYRRALRMMNSPAAAAFDLASEPRAARDRYGPGVFGQGCLLARRLIEQGVATVEVNLGDFTGAAGNWDTHQNNFATVKELCSQLDAGWSSLMEDLADRGLLDSTTILWMGEFGRTPTINAAGGRDHFPNAWSCVLAGGGIRGGQAYGSTSDDGMTVNEGKVAVGDVLTTLCAALGVDPRQHNLAEMGRPIAIAEGEPIRDVLA